MNQIVIDNRHKIDTACRMCFLMLDKYHKAVEAFHEEKRRIAASLYIQEEKERMVNRAEDALKKTANNCYEEIKQNLDVIRAAASAMENLMDIGPDLQNALSVVNSLGKAMPSETRARLVEQFKGQRQALTILKTAYNEAGISAEPYFDGLISEASKVLDDLDDKAYRMVVQPGTNMLVAINFGSDLEKYAESLGVQLTGKYRETVNTSDALNRQMRAVMGLGAKD